MARCVDTTKLGPVKEATGKTSHARSASSIRSVHPHVRGEDERIIEPESISGGSDMSRFASPLPRVNVWGQDGDRYGLKKKRG